MADTPTDARRQSGPARDRLAAGRDALLLSLYAMSGVNEPPPACYRATDPVASPPLQLPAPRTLAWTLLQDQRDDQAVELLKGLDEHAATLAELAPTGLHALRNRNLEAWTHWRQQVAASSCRDLKRFLRGLERDETAVTNAILLPYSNGPAEGNVHRIKLIKRTTYGRANFELLRKKIPYHDA